MVTVWINAKSCLLGDTSTGSASGVSTKGEPALVEGRRVVISQVPWSAGEKNDDTSYAYGSVLKSLYEDSLSRISFEGLSFRSTL